MAAKPFLNLKPGIDFPEDGTDVLPYLKALEEKCMKLEDSLASAVSKIDALETVVYDDVKGNSSLDSRVSALEPEA